MEFNSPLGKTRVNSPEREMRTFTVPDIVTRTNGNIEDNSDYSQSRSNQPSKMTVEDIQAMRQAFAQGTFNPNEQGFPQEEQNFPQQSQPMPRQNSKSDSELKSRIEFLVGIARGKLDVPIELNDSRAVFSLRTLKRKEQEDLAALMESFKQTFDGGKIMVKPTDAMRLRKATLKYSLYKIDGIDIDVVLQTTGGTMEERLYVRDLFLDELDDALVLFLYSKYEELTTNHLNKFSVTNEKDAKEVAEAVRKSS